VLRSGYCFRIKGDKVTAEHTGWRCLWPVKAHLGEGLIWDDRNGSLCFVDTDAPAVHVYYLESGERRTWVPPCFISSIAVRAAGGFIATSRDGYAVIDPAKGQYTTLFDPRSDPKLARFNDGTLDHCGRFWSGTVSNSQWDDTTTAVDKETTLKDMGNRDQGEVFRLDGSLKATREDTGYIATNGPAFSPDGKLLYENDSIRRLTYAYDLGKDGSLSNKRVHIRHEPTVGFPDGMVCDAEGGLWMAFYDDPYFRRFAPDGKLAELRELPVRQGLRPAFGGPKYDRLFLICGSLAFTEQAWLDQPLAGSLLEILNPGVSGVPTVPFPG
jgi:D-xylonolactonase